MKCLIIQTAFLGDVILATPVIEQIRKHYPKATIDILVRKGNESLLDNHPHIRQVFVLNKGQEKYRNLWRMLKTIRQAQYDKVINLHRFASSGFLSAFSGAKEKIGFNKNPFSWTFDKRVPHQIDPSVGGQHEVQRNLALVTHFTDDALVLPSLYPSKDDFRYVAEILSTQGSANKKYITLAPASVWFTKRLPEAKWVELIGRLGDQQSIFLIGAPGDKALCDRIQETAKNNSAKVLAGQLSLLQSAALMQGAAMNYVNDSAPLHLASAMNAPVTAFFCSTVPNFGFGPLSEKAQIMESSEELPCRPCGLHGKKTCPKGHFKCSLIDLKNLESIS